MIELTKAEKKLAKELIKKGILKRHAEWHREILELLDRPFDDEIRNEFGKSMILTDKARKFFKEAMWMEDFTADRGSFSDLENCSKKATSLPKMLPCCRTT